ncbi:MarR family winged helix-turn-helix transcriptional regulator [Modestobacter sp. VKM Ac-2986]|uniref:MarR family winged helix-turn-helix transcriptional regulator n=1 Tax=Modestobacter sp. VKM Ac-2986 TaxID=3004140 RepID=UPI0022AAC26E|nr:MarR family winged helix-turn-helix transcriptional regulator [Modestobacter sp. VKM Ac-2986]MCZ2828839.1 MarR family winged helix-turn-helix transcriptional regulator [Modestobacter sp. VKM Ac-2986]
MGQPMADDLGFLLSRASGQVVRATNAALAEHGLRVRTYSVLVFACEAADGLNQRELAGFLGLDPSQVVLLVDELVAAGLVERQAAETDRRTRLVVPTAQGRRVREAAGEAADAAVEVPLGLLGDAERDRLRDMLTRIWTATG